MVAYPEPSASCCEKSLDDLYFNANDFDVKNTQYGIPTRPADR